MHGFENKGGPFAEFFRFLEDLADRGRNILLRPAIDVYETDHEVVVETDLPGWKKEELSLKTIENVLYITGTRQPAPETETRYYHRRERRVDRIEEAVRLPVDAPGETIRASLTEGVLKVTIPKPAPAPGRRITIE